MNRQGIALAIVVEHHTAQVNCLAWWIDHASPVQFTVRAGGLGGRSPQPGLQSTASPHGPSAQYTSGPGTPDRFSFRMVPVRPCRAAAAIGRRDDETEEMVSENGSGARPLRVGIDIGGTFTDLIAFDERTGALSIGKVLTTPQEPAAGVEAGIRE